jgi:hypothetical protein
LIDLKKLRLNRFEVFANPENRTAAGELIVLYSGAFKFAITIDNW